MATNYFSQIFSFIFTITIIVFVIIIFSIILKIIRTKVETDNNKEKLPYIPTSHFMTSSEISFYKQLEVAVGDKYHIVPQVQLSKIITVDKYSTREFYKYNNKIDRKTVDFVLYTKPDFKFFKAIELNDYTHDNNKRIQRDLFVKEAMKSAGLQLEIVDHRDSFKA